MSKTFIAICTLIGMIIGAGVLGIPYVIMKSGFGLGLASLAVIGIVIAITTLYLGEIALRTKHNHQLTGYAGLYLGRTGRKWMFLSFMLEIYSALLAYLIAEGDSISALIFGTTQYSIYCAVIFWVFLSLLTYFGLKALEEGEFVGVGLIFVMIVSIVVLLWSKIDPVNLTYNNFSNVFTPFGVIVFAFLGFAAIPEVKRILGEDKKPMKRIIIISYLFSFIVYALFALVVLGFKGQATPQIATLAIGRPFILLGMLTIFTSYLALSMAFVDTLRFDFQKTKFKSWLLTISVPLILYIILKLTGIAEFTKVLGIGGAIAGGLTAVLIILMVDKAKKYGSERPPYSMPYSQIIKWILIAFFIIGALAQVIPAV